MNLGPAFASRLAGMPPGLRFAMDLLHQGLHRAPADLAEVAVVVRHQLLAAIDAVDVKMRPSEVAVGFAQATVANVGGPGAHRLLQCRQIFECERYWAAAP